MSQFLLQARAVDRRKESWMYLDWLLLEPAPPCTTSTQVTQHTVSRSWFLLPSQPLTNVFLAPVSHTRVMCLIDSMQNAGSMRLLNLYIWPAGELELCHGRIGLTDVKECTLILLKQVDSLFSCRARCSNETHRSCCLVQSLARRLSGRFYASVRGNCGTDH